MIDGHAKRDAPQPHSELRRVGQKVEISMQDAMAANEEKERRRKFNAARDELSSTRAIEVEGDAVYPTPKASGGDGGEI